MRTKLCVSFLAFAALALSACSSKRRPPDQQQPVAFEITTDRLDGVPATVFRVRAALAEPASDVTVTWTLGDSRTKVGEAIEFSYDQPGIYELTATAARPGRVASTRTFQLTVFDPRPGASLPGTAIEMPVLLGDVDADGELTAADVHRVAKVAGALEGLPLERRRSADFDVNGTIDVHDARLLAQAVAAGGELPSSMQPSAGPRGSVVTLVSRHLVDLNAQAQVRIGNAPPRPVRRLYQGRATALVPLDAVGPATLEPITPATIPVVLMVGGADVERFEFALENPPEVRGDEPQQLADAMATLVAATEQAEQVIARSFERFGQTTTDRAMLQSYFRFALGSFRDASQQMTALVATLSPEEARALGYFFQVGGLRELNAAARAARLAMARLASSSAGPSAGPASGVDLLNLLCAANDATELAERVDTVLSTACGIAAIGAGLSGFLLGPIGPAVAAAILAICNGVSVASATLEVVTTILPKPGNTLAVTAERVSAALPTFHIRVAAPLEKDLLCGAPGSFLVNQVRDLIVRRLSQRLTAWLSFGFIRNFPFESRDGSLRQRIVAFIVDQIQSLAGVVVNAAGLQEWIEDKKNELCRRFRNGSVAIPIDQLTLLQHDPVGDGTLTRPGAGSNEPAVFVCTAQSTGNGIVRIDAATVACGKTLAGSTSINCRGVTVTFCQGDNGNLLDDIFELIVNGEVLLAPSVPVRRVCGSRTLSPGEHEVLLRGRAAPDNIGTYFLEASPGRLIGPPLSGTDLTAGRVFRWTLRIDPPQQ